MTELKKVLNTKLNKKKGFTLAELLVVVAIIAVLVAISIPVFGGALQKAQFATDEANVRATYAEQLVAVMSESDAGKVVIPKEGTESITDAAQYSTVTIANNKITVTHKDNAKLTKEIPVDSDVTFATT